jgi:2-methylcitrate dehydratase
MAVREIPQYTRDYYDAEKRYIGNAVQVYFQDGGSTERREVHFPIGHRKRRAEGMPVLRAKFERSIAEQLPAAQCRALSAAFSDQRKLEATPVDALMALMVKQLG